MVLLYDVLVVVSLALFAQTMFSLYLMLYTWEHPQRLAASNGPKSFLPPRLAFTVLLPARSEEAVIYNTIRRLARANYPAHLIEIVAICHENDSGTIAQIRRAMSQLPGHNLRVETFSGGPINKPRGLNVGFRRSRNEVVTVFDAEDDVDADIFNVVNTVMLEEETGIVQAGVQLMNFRDHWYSLHNCLEYYFWFKSRLHFHSHVGMIPLGGNTVFMRRSLIERIGGWDEYNLTEDAEIGLRLSALGEPIRVVYDAQHVTREETPPTIGAFVRQRTRWSQGFLQVLGKGSWRALPRLGQRLLALYTLSYPLVQASLLVFWPLTLLTVFWLKAPLPVTMLAFFPLYAFILQFVVTTVGAYQFTREYKFRMPLTTPLLLAVSFFPYQWMLGFGAIRAVVRQMQGARNWEKTAHVGAHRKPELVPAADFARLLDEAGDRLGAERGSVLVLNREARTFSVLASRGLPPEIGSRSVLDASTGIAAHVAKTLKPAILNGHPLPPDISPLLAQPKLRSAIVFPIQEHGSAVTVVSVSSTLTTLGEEALHWLAERVEVLRGNQASTTASY
jgi:cellulose synthase/poly-beta-1,6-N-acetylglucosamine synthase-like glycosyltransferase